MELIIRNKLEVKNPDQELHEYLKEILTILNPEWLDAQTFGRWTGNIPKFLYQYQETEDSIIVPRGRLVHVLEDLGREWTIQDERVAPEAEKLWPEGNIILRPGDQEPAVQELLSFDNGYLSAPAGSGKALAMDTPVPTPLGWTTIGSLKTGDLVFGANGDPTEVLWVSPVQRRRSYKLRFDTGQETIACEDHLWLTHTTHERDRRNELQGRVRSTREIVDTLIGPGNRANHSIGMAAPVNLPDANLPIPPYTLGAWLGDGTSRTAAITSADPEVLQHIQQDGFQLTKLVDKYGWSMHRCGQELRREENGRLVAGEFNLHSLLKKNDLLRNKHIPAAYKRASFNQRLAMVQGLMDTDGTVSTKGNCEFSVTNKTLASDFLELIRSLGIKGKLTKGNACLYGRWISPRFRVHFTTALPVCRLKRKAARLPQQTRECQRRHFIVAAEEAPEVDLVCITVAAKDALYLVGESFIPTHNTVMGLEAIRRLGLKALWLTHRKELKDQVVEVAVRLLEIPEQDIGILHGKSWRVGEQLTIGMVPTLRKRDLTDISREFGVVVVDEAHHVPSTTFLHVLDKFWAKRLYGLTATAYRRDKLDEVMFNAIGPIVAKIEHVELFEDENLIKPTIKRRLTGWSPPNSHLLEYSDFMEKMVSDPRRNDLIVQDIARECVPGNTCVVLVKRTKHAEILTKLLQDRGIRCEFVVGSLDVESEDDDGVIQRKKRSIPKEIRNQVVSDFKEGRIQVLVATYDLLAEGFDYKPLNRLFMATPIKWKGTVVQSIGRIQRPAEGKHEAVVYDYVDEPIDMFARQAESRLFRVYGPMGMKVEDT